jgi:hypothetical protein
MNAARRGRNTISEFSRLQTFMPMLTDKTSAIAARSGAATSGRSTRKKSFEKVSLLFTSHF